MKINMKRPERGRAGKLQAFRVKKRKIGGIQDEQRTFQEK